MSGNPQSVGDILDRLEHLAEQNDEVSVGDTVEAFGRRSYGPFLLVPALLELSPIGGVPGVPSGPFIGLAAAACVALALTVPPLEIVPFASSAPMGAIAMFGLAILVHDGALMIAATLLACVAVAVGINILA